MEKDGVNILSETPLVLLFRVKNASIPVCTILTDVSPSRDARALDGITSA